MTQAPAPARLGYRPGLDGLRAISVAAVVLYLVWKRHNLIGAMVTGRKRIDQAIEPGEPAPRLVFASSRLAVSLLLACAALVYFIVRAGS